MQHLGLLFTLTLLAANLWGLMLAAGLYWSVIQRNHLPEAATALDCLLFTSLVFGGYLSRRTTNLITRYRAAK